MLNKIKVIVIAGIILGSQSASGFDGDRQGFMLGVGLGLHSIDLDSENNTTTIETDTESGFATTFKLGGGLNSQFSLYYVRNASWYSAPYFDGLSASDIIYSIGISGLGGTYYFSPSAPSWNVSAAVGLGDISAPFESDIDSDIGKAAMLGIGYEFSEYLQFEAALLATEVDEIDDSRIDLTATSVQLMFSYLIY